MSSPWCQPPGTFGRGPPKLSPNDAVPYTGKTYPPPVNRAETSGATSTGPPGTSPPTSGSGALGSVGRTWGGRGLTGSGRGAAGSSATAVACTLPTRISLPAGSPPCADVSRTRSAATDPCAPGGPALRVPLLAVKTESDPQSSREAGEPGAVEVSDSWSS